MAARWPNSRFLGVDLSARQIADGNRRIKYFHLENVTLREADLADLKLPSQSFDYVICHGVFSWVAPSVQAAILELIGSCLSDGGVAAVSYNVLPGWHLRNPVKDILRYYARTDGSTQERVARARAALAALETYTGPVVWRAFAHRGEAVSKNSRILHPW
jgi:SAM-dependent methyltransferase